jgi:hypothetical protein
MCRVHRYLLVGVCALMVAGGLSAQSTTGRLIGEVYDEGGVALPGVTVTVQSEALLGGPRTEITDANGEFAFLGLAPGVYSLQASLAGFPTQDRAEIKVRLGSATKIDIEMPSGTFAGEIEVVAETPVIDPTQVNMQQVFDSTYLKNAAIGSANRGYQYVLLQAAGSDGSVESDSNVSVFGSTSGENTFYVDGMDTTDPITSTWSHDLNFDAIEEIQFQTAGYEAQYGRAIGGVVNLVTKSGGNTFSGTLDARYRDESFYESGDHYDANELDAMMLNVAATLGGPVIRDKLWFFASFQKSKTEQTPTFSTNTWTFDGEYPFLKLSWQVDPSWRVVAKYSSDSATIDNDNARITNYVDPDTMAWRDQPGEVISAELNAVLSDALLWNTVIGAQRSGLDRIPYQDNNVLSHWSYATDLYTQNEYRQDYSDRDRDELSTDLTWFVDDLGGSHEFKGGFEYGKAMENASTICLTGESDGDYGCDPGTYGINFYDHQRYEDFQHPYYMYIENTIPPQDFVGTIYSGFVQDAWRPVPNLTLKLGVRYDDITWQDNDGTERLWLDKIQPRLGFAWDITGDSRNVLRGSWGRFMHPANSSVPSFLQTAEAGRFYYASCTYGAYRRGVGDMYLTPEECQAVAAEQGWDYWGVDPEGWDPAGWIGPFSSAATSHTEIDPDLGATYADEWIIAYERALWDRSSIEISYVSKDTEDIIEDTCRGNFYDGPSEDADCEAFLIFNYPRRDYDGATVKFETRTLDWMTLIASYTYAHARGSADTRHYFWGDYDYYPWDYMNMYGYTMQQRRHRMKVNGFFLLPYDFTVGFDAWWSDKFHYNTLDDEYPGAPAGTTVFAEPRGTRQANTNYQLDLQFSKGFAAGPVRLELIATIINVLSTERPADADDICERVHGCSDPEGDGLVDLGAAIEWQDPRRYEIGFRIEF